MSREGLATTQLSSVELQVSRISHAEEVVIKHYLLLNSINPNWLLLNTLKSLKVAK